jgi:hypothetical protein
MFEGYITTCFGSCAKVHHKTNKILKGNSYVKPSSYFTIPIRPHISTDIRILQGSLCNASIYFYQKHINVVDNIRYFT